MLGWNPRSAALRLLTLVVPLLLAEAYDLPTVPPVKAAEASPPAQTAGDDSAPLRVIRGVPYLSTDSVSDSKRLLADIYLPVNWPGPAEAMETNGAAPRLAPRAGAGISDARPSPGVAKPAASESPLFPAILMIHGGAWMSGNKVQVTSHARYAAQRGYLVVAINYRLAPQYPFPAQLVDCCRGLRWMRANSRAYHIDPQRIAVYGYSAGANLACLLGMCAQENLPVAAPADEKAEAKGSDPFFQQPPLADQETPPEATRVRAIVAGGAPCEFDWIPADSQRLAYWLGGSRREVPELYHLASPTTFASADDPPVFLFHGDRDRVVPVASPRLMSACLAKVGVAAQLHVVPQAGHLEAFLDAGARKLAIDFLDSVLRDTPGLK